MTEHVLYGRPGWGSVPADGTVMTESAAIALHLDEEHPGAQLAPPPGSPERATCLCRLVWLATKRNFQNPPRQRRDLAPRPMIPLTHLTRRSATALDLAIVRGVAGHHFAPSLAAYTERALIPSCPDV
jgi:glutathione S-transferase